MHAAAVQAYVLAAISRFAICYIQVLTRLLYLYAPSDGRVQQAIHGEVDLRQYLAQIETELAKSSTSVVEDYIAQKTHLLQLHTQIKV